MYFVLFALMQLACPMVCQQLGPSVYSTDVEFTNFPWMALNVLSHFQAEVSHTFPECIDNGAPLHACF